MRAERPHIERPPIRTVQMFPGGTQLQTINFPRRKTPYRVIGLTFVLVTDANVANRMFRLQIVTGDGADIIMSPGNSFAVQAASQTRTWCFYPLIPGPADGIAGEPLIVPIPDDYIVTPEWLLRLVGNNIQAGDVISQIALVTGWRIDPT